MTDRKISELTNITGANVDDANDEIAIVDASANETKAITRAELFKSVSNLEVTGIITGTAVTQDPVDTTADRLLKYFSSGRGPFGLGSTGSVPTQSDFQSTEKPAGWSRTSSSTTNIDQKPGGNDFGYSLVMRFDSQNFREIWGDVLNDNLWVRRYRSPDGFSDWRLIYSSGNAVGTIAGGAIIESDSTANGSYRWTSNGTMECWATVTLTYTNGNRLDFDWSFPVEFDSGESPNIQITINEAETSITPSPEDLLVSSFPSIANPHISTVITMRRDGAVTFDAADTGVCFVRAIGKKTP